MKKSKTTISDIAKYLNISTSTVSRALNDHELINEKTKEEVRNAARLLNYRPNQHARSLQTGRSGVLGLLLPDLKSLFYQQIQVAVEQIAQAQGQQVVLSFSQNTYIKEQKCLDFFEQLRVDGLIAVVAENTQDHGHFELFREQTPVVFISRRVPLLHASMLLSNDRQGSYDATRFFIDQGRTKLAFMGAKCTQPNIKEREKGFLDALKDVKLDLPKARFYCGPITSKAAYQYAHQLTQQGQFPDALLLGSAEAAIGWLNYCYEFGIKVPEQLGMITWNETDYCAFLRPSISSISQNGFSMGTTAAQTLFQQIRDKNTTAPMLKLFRPQLVHRSSSAVQKTGRTINPQQIDNQHLSA